jgi:uncharacterized repeat protein (TIGR03803 family)
MKPKFGRRGAKMSKLDWVTKASTWMKAYMLVLVCATAGSTSYARDFKSLAAFDQTNGTGPDYVSLVQGLDGSFYGTTVYGGTNEVGTVFKVTAAGALTTLYSFCSKSDCTDGTYPLAGLVLGKDGNFYGAASEGGIFGSCGLNSCGTIFKITPQGGLTILHSFDSTGGAYPSAPLIQSKDGNFYGSTIEGGSRGNGGTIFEISPRGDMVTLYSFNSSASVGPYGALLQTNDGNLYGVTIGGGASDDGMVYQLSPNGTFATLYSFCGVVGCADGSFPYTGMIQGTDGNLYGTTSEGGFSNFGTVFKITLDGILTTLHSFAGSDGQAPVSSLIQATDGELYGTAGAGGYRQSICSHLGGCGILFEITPSGTFGSLHFFNLTAGSGPDGGLVQGTNGNFFGTTNQRCSTDKCTYGCGTVFTFDAALGAFVESLPTSGVVGAAIKILGTNLTGATSVTFNGTAATFTVNSKSEITTTVPTGATTGTVQVITLRLGTLSSNVPFTVRP